MRLFVAIKIPEDIRDELVAVEGKLAGIYRARWVKRDNIHLTLKFLGEVEEKRLGDTAKIVSEISKDNPGFDLNLENIGGFPNLKRPRVLWVGVQRGEKNTVCLMEQLEKNFARLGIKPEKREKNPHITLGRVKGPTRSSDKKGRDGVNKLTYKSRVFRADAISLIKSELTPRGAIHTVLERYALQQ